MNKKELWLRIKNYHFNHIVPANLWEKVYESFGGTDSFTKALADKISKKNNGGIGCSSGYGGGD